MALEDADRLKNLGALIIITGKSFLLYFLVFLSLSTAAQHISVHPLNLSKGHFSDLATFALRDQLGFLWIGTDNGLKRYDGYEIKNYTPSKEHEGHFGGSYIAVMTELENGDIWAGGRKLSLYNRNTDSFSNYQLHNNGLIRALQEENAILWIGGDGFGLLGFDLRSRVLTYQGFKQGENAYIQTIIKNNTSLERIPNHGFVGSSENQKTLWLQASNSLILFDSVSHQSHVIPLPEASGFDNESATSMIQDHLGIIWIASQVGLLRYDPINDEFKQYRADKKTPGALPSAQLWSIFEDSKGRIWIGTDKSGVLIYNRESDNFLHYKPSSSDENAFPHVAIGKLIEDSEGHIWVTASVAGIRQISPHLDKFVAIQPKNNAQEPFRSGYISDLHEDEYSNLWIAIDGIGLNKYNPNTRQHRHFSHDPNNPTSISSNSVLSIEQDQQNHLWIGTWAGGLNRLDPATGEFKHFKHGTLNNDENSLAGNNIFRIEATSDDKLYLSVWEVGLQVYDIHRQRFLNYFTSNYGSSIHSILDFLVNEDDSVWIAGYGGLELFDPKTESFQRFDTQEAEVIVDLHKDTQGIVWLASNQGLGRLNPDTKEVRYFTKEDGLNDNFIVSIEEDSQGALWLGTRDGLTKFSPNTHSFEIYGELDGLGSQKFNRFAHIFTRDKKMYFGGQSTVNYFDPVYMPKNPYAPKVQLTGIKIFQRDIHTGEQPLLNKNINTAKLLTLQHDKNDITFKFSALNLITPSKNQYKYTLEGLDKQWIYTDSDNRTAHYSNLQPGEYTFKVFGSNNDGVWSHTATSINISILPPWWKSKIAKVTYFVISIIAIALFLHLLFRYSNKKRFELEHRLNHDSLTGLPNRLWMETHLPELISGCRLRSVNLCAFYIDGDNFKKINDKYGHAFGDALIQETSKRLQGTLPPHSMLIRLEGAQFFIVVENIEAIRDAEELARTLSLLFKKPFKVNQLEASFRYNIGVFLSNAEKVDPRKIMRSTDIALRSAQRAGGGSWRAYNEAMLEDTEELSAIEEDLLHALSDDQFTVVYQPLITLTDESLKGFELLIRWQHPTKGFIPPDKFIPIAERSGSIVDIGYWIFRTACYQQRQWLKLLNGRTPPTIAVNVSPVQLAHSDFIDEIDNIFRSTHADPRFIKVEITETALMEDVDAISCTLDKLRERGIELAIDDFGTGYSSLGYLGTLPAQLLKIDRSFVNGLTESDNKTGAIEIIKATISLAHNLRMEVVAEGIETQRQLEDLRSYGCDFGQGYYINKPLSPLKATELITQSF